MGAAWFRRESEGGSTSDLLRQRRGSAGMSRESFRLRMLSPCSLSKSRSKTEEEKNMDQNVKHIFLFFTIIMMDRSFLDILF